MLRNAPIQLQFDRPDVERNIDLLIVENVGNLVCPASLALGAYKSVLVDSISEGDDKPYKYPSIG